MTQGITPPHVAVVTCAVLEDEIRALAAEIPNIGTIEVLEYGLHGEPARLRAELQATLERVERTTRAEVIVLGYGLCSRGTEGVVAHRCRLVLARAHDCITLLLGCRKRYADYVGRHPGTYWYSPGWNRCHIPPGPERYNQLRAQYLEKYGEDNADYLMEMEQHWMKTYDRATYVDLGIGATREDMDYTKRCADWLGWNFDRVCGDPALLRQLLAGPWDKDRFLVLEPGRRFRMTTDERVVELDDDDAPDQKDL